MRKRLVRCICAVVISAILAGPAAGVVAAHNTVNGAPSTTKEIEEKQKKIKEAEAQKKGLKKGLSDVQAIKKSLEAKKADLASFVVELDGELQLIEERIAQLKEQIVVKESEIEETQKQLEDAVNREVDQQGNMVVRAQMMYENRGFYALELLTQATGFGDFLNRAEYMEKVVSYDKEQWNELVNTRKLVELCEQQLELEKDILDQTRENVEIEQNTIELFIEQKEQEILAYQTDINNQEAAIKEYEDMIRQQDEEIKALEKEIEEAKKRIYDGGKFKFPLASYTKVSDDYGNRIHPILKVPQFHNGIDFAAPKGTAIYAAYKGEVVAADYSPTMGNYVMIDHGNNLYTVYMHASTLKVKKGQEVDTGDTIALVGSTGRSTGNHLHFSVRKNGSYVSPWDYITK